jgi:hypothetical protein
VAVPAWVTTLQLKVWVLHPAMPTCVPRCGVSKNATVPVGLPAESEPGLVIDTVAVKVTDWPLTDVPLPVTAVVVEAADTVWATVGDVGELEKFVSPEVYVALMA